MDSKALLTTLKAFCAVMFLFVIPWLSYRAGARDAIAKTALAPKWHFDGGKVCIMLDGQLNKMNIDSVTVSGWGQW